MTCMIRAWVFVLLVIATATGQERDADLNRLSDQARLALAAKNWQEAAQALEKLARLAPAVAEVQANLGLALYFEGRAADALAAFDRARKLNPALPQVNVMTGLCDAELGLYREAIDLLEPAFAHPPDDETGRLIGLHLARSYAGLKQFDKAFAAGEELVRRYPTDPEILYQVSRLHSDRSYVLMSELVRSAPDSAWTHYANAQVQESLDRFDAAAQEYRNALARDPHLLGAHYRLGRVILSASRTPDSIALARREFELELELSPRNADAEYELGEIAREHGNLDGAVGHFARALRYHPEFVEAQVGMAKTLMKLGRPAEAVPHLAEAARLDPGNKIPHYLLSSAYKALGDTAAAAKEIALYQKMGALKPAAASRSGAHDDALNQP
jgi:tetratricopeptide (TPR) repeat protein